MIINTSVLLNKNKIKLIKSNFKTTLKKNKVLVKILYSGVCRSQLMEIDMKRGKDKFLPHMFGHEAVGIVERIGSNIKKIKVNDKVVLSWIKGKGINSSGDNMIIEGQKINYGPISTLSNYSIISENRCFKVNDNFPSEIGCFFGCSILTGAGMVLNRFQIRNSDFVLVIGAGGVGFSSLLALKALNIKKVVVIDTDIKKKKLINKLGFKNIYKPNDKNLYKKLYKITNGHFFDYCFESAGSINSIELGFKYINYSGKLLFASHPEFDKKIRLDPHDLIKGKKIYGSWGGDVLPDIDIMKIYRLFKKKKLLRFIETKTYPFKNLNNAIDDFRKGKILRPIIKMGHEK